MSLQGHSSSGRPWLSRDVSRGGTRYKGSSGWLKFSSMMLALISLYGEWAVLPLKRSLRANQWSPADASSHKFRVAHRGAAPSSQRRASEAPSLTMANQYFYVRARRPRPNSAPERCPRDNTWTRRHGGHGGAHGWRVRGRALSATTRKR